jgi:hypothetical protein
MSVSRKLVEVIDSDACASITVGPSKRWRVVEVVLELWEVGPNGGDRITKRLDLDWDDALALATALRRFASDARGQRDPSEGMPA